MKFPFAVYHDAEDKGYGYDLFARHDSGSHFHFVLRTLVPHTGFLIRRRLCRPPPRIQARARPPHA